MSQVGRTPPTFAENLKRHMGGMTQAELAKRTGIHPRTISTYARSVNHPNVSALIEICKALECTPNDLLDGVCGWRSE